MIVTMELSENKIFSNNKGMQSVYVFFHYPVSK